MINLLENVNVKITSKRGAENIQLKILDSTFSVMKLPPTETIPLWALNCDVFSITRTGEELSIVCPSECLPTNEVFKDVENDWKCGIVTG